ncbi:MAG: ABC transporter substrate-binding protein [Dehalococcoidia bacterium]
MTIGKQTRHWGQDGRYGRRVVLRSALVAAGSAAFLAACGGDSDTQTGSQSSGGSALSTGATAAAEEGTPKPGGQLREATITQAPHFSPYHPGADPSYVNFFRREWGYYDRLWALKDIKDADKLDLMLASSLEQPDDVTTIVKMPPSKFQNRAPANGRDVTAEDVAAAVEFLRKPPASGGAYLQGKDFKGATAVDPLTIRYEGNNPYAFFLEVASPVIVPKEMLDEQTLKTSIPVGSGPFEYKTHTQGSIEEIKKYDGYRNTGNVYIAERKLTFVPDEAAIEAAFRAGQIDAMEFNNIKQRDQVGKDLGSKITLTDIPSSSGMALVLNVNRPPWNDIRAREAVYRAIDVDRVANVVYFGDAERTWYFSKGSFTRNPLGPEPIKDLISYDPKKAADLVKAAGIDPNQEFEFMVPVEDQKWVDSGRLMAEDLEKAGIKVRVNPVVRNIYLQRAGPKPGDFDITMSVLLSYQYAQTESGTFWNSTSLQDPEVDAMVDKIYATTDAKAREPLSHEFERMLARKYSNLVPVLSSINHYGWHSYLKGYNNQYLPYRQQFGRWLDK